MDANILNFRLWKSKNALSRALCSSKSFLGELSWTCTWCNNKNFNNIQFNSTALFMVKKYKLYWFSNSLLAVLSPVPKQCVLLLTQILCLWWRWWPRVTLALNFLTSCQDFYINFVKSMIMVWFINIWHSSLKSEFKYENHQGFFVSSRCW